jgi:hypothetical protein
MRSSCAVPDRTAGRTLCRAHPRPAAGPGRALAIRCANAPPSTSVSPSTVVAAYDQLLAQGLVEARKQRGFLCGIGRQNRHFQRRWVTESAIEAGVPQAPGRHGRAGGAGAPINATALIRGMFHQGSKPQPGMGVFPPDWLATTFMTAAVRKVTSSGRCRRVPCSTASPWATAACAGAGAKLAGLGVPAPPGRSSPPWAPPMRWTS